MLKELKSTRGDYEVLKKKNLELKKLNESE